MRTSTLSPLTTSDVTDLTLKSAPQRASTFLQGAGDPNISALLATTGWTADDAVHGYLLISKIHVAHVVPPPPDVVAAAITACEAWQAGPLVRLRAKLQLLYPEQAAYLFDGLVAGKGMDAVLNVSTFSTRRRALENDKTRKATRKADHEALAFMTKEGVTPAEIKRLAGLVEASHHVVEARDDGTDALRLEALRNVYAWLLSWSEIARTVVTRRDHLIRLGLAKRRSTKAKKVVVAPVVVTPAPPPPVAPPAAPPPTPPVVVAPPAPVLDEQNGPSSRAA